MFIGFPICTILPFAANVLSAEKRKDAKKHKVKLQWLQTSASHSFAPSYNLSQTMGFVRKRLLLKELHRVCIMPDNWRCDRIYDDKRMDNQKVT
jgi:hypothetical protein